MLAAHTTVTEPATLGVTCVWPYLEWGGVQTQLLTMAPHLPARVRIRALVPTGTDPVLLRYLADAGVTTIVAGRAVDLAPALTWAAKVNRRCRDLAAHLDVVRAVRRFPPTEVLHVDLPPWSSSFVVRAMARRRAVVQTFHTRPPVLTGWRRRLWRARLTLVLRGRHYHDAHGNADVRDGFSALLGRPLHGVVTSMAVDVDMIQKVVSGSDRARVRSRLGVPPHACLVIGCGQLLERKGIALLFDAVDRLRQGGNAVEVRWIGSGPDHDRLSDHARRLGLGEVIVPSNAMGSRAELYELLGSADVYAQPSLEDGLPAAILEAMAAGVPVVATAINGIPEAITDGVEGRLVEPGDVTALAEAITDMSDSETGRRRGAAALARARSFDAPVVAARLVGVYDAAHHSLHEEGTR